MTACSMGNHDLDVGGYEVFHITGPAAKGLQGSSEHWLLNDQHIQVPQVDASSNAWIEGWGIIFKE